MSASPIIIRFIHSLEKQIINFWQYSNGDCDFFNFNLFFKTYSNILKDKLSRHGLLGFKNYILYITTDKLNKPHITHEGIHLDKDPLLRYRYYNNIFAKNIKYKNLLDLYNEMEQANYLNHREKVLLTDKCIHAEHCSGTIFDINKLKEYYETYLVK